MSRRKRRQLRPTSTIWPIFTTEPQSFDFSDPIPYTFDEDAHEILKSYHDELKRRKLAMKHENRRGVITKAIGQMARMSMIVHVLDSAGSVHSTTCKT